MTTKNFSLGGVANKVELGKDGHVLDASNAGYFRVAGHDDVLIRLKGAAAQASDEYATKAQVDAVHALAGGYLSYSYDASAGISQLNGQGTGEGGAIRYGDTYKVGVSGTFLGDEAQAGDLVTALVAGADIADNTSNNGDWMLVEIRSASDFADGVTTDHSGGKIIVKDLGISTDKLAALAVTEPKMADNAVATRAVVDRNITGPKVAVGTLLDEHLALSTVTKAKLAAPVQTTLTNADTAYGTRIPNIASAIGGSFDSDNDNAIAAQTNYLTGTTIVSQLAQADARMKLDNDDNALRKATVAFDAGAANVGAPIKSGRVLLGIRVKPTLLPNGADCVMSIGTAAQPALYASSAVIDLYETDTDFIPLNEELSADTQVIATITQGTATQGSFLVTVVHG